MKYTTHIEGHYGIEDPELKFSKKGLQEDSYQKELKFKRHKSANRHGNEEQTDNTVYTLLQSYGVQAGNYLRTGKINLTYLASKEYSDLQYFCVTISQRIDYSSMV